MSTGEIPLFAPRDLPECLRKERRPYRRTVARVRRFRFAEEARGKFNLRDLSWMRVDATSERCLAEQERISGVTLRAGTGSEKERLSLRCPRRERDHPFVFRSFRLAVTFVVYRVESERSSFRFAYRRYCLAEGNANS